MKNVNLIPTDKPSRLYEDVDSDLQLGYDFTVRQGMLQNQHIYITSDEEINEGDWFYDGDGELCKYTSDYVVNPNGWNDNKKIILTTDQDLIEDGVQSIDDEFLEWFIKNPSCQYGGYKDIDWDKIITQKEKPKQEELERGITITHVGKQETNEEASKRIYPDKTTPGWIDHWSATERRCFIEGAQWSQQEILYFLYEEITERRPYSSSKMCEVVIEFIQKMNLKK